MPLSSVFPESVRGNPKGHERKGSVPAPKKQKPKVRPPQSLRDKIPLYGKLPKYSGPYKVAIIDIEFPAANPRTFSHIKKQHTHILALETVLLTIYYPAHLDTGSGPSPSDKNMRQGGIRVKSTSGEPPVEGPEKPIFPLIMFSHGMGGSRTACSSLCCEVASYGFVQSTERERAGNLEHKPGADKRIYDVVDHIFAKEDKNDASPGHQIDRELRQAQVKMRLAELEKAYAAMVTIWAGDGEALAKKNLCFKGVTSASSQALEGVDWKSWKNRFHLTEVTMVGHSFGAAATVKVLRHQDRFQWVSQGTMYDVWGMAVVPPEMDPRHRSASHCLGSTLKLSCSG